MRTQVRLITITLLNEAKTTTIQARCEGGLCYHRAYRPFYVERVRYPWVITHEPTGFGVSQDIPSRARARAAMASLLASGVDWLATDRDNVKPTEKAAIIAARAIAYPETTGTT